MILTEFFSPLEALNLSGAGYDRISDRLAPSALFLSYPRPLVSAEKTLFTIGNIRTDPNAPRISRRRFLTLSGTAAGTGLLLSACGKNPEAPEAIAQKQTLAADLLKELNLTTTMTQDELGEAAINLIYNNPAFLTNTELGSYINTKGHEVTITTDKQGEPKLDQYEPDPLLKYRSADPVITSTYEAGDY